MTIQGQGSGHLRPDRPQVAVVGAGVADLTAAYLLQRAWILINPRSGVALYVILKEAGWSGR